MRITMTLTTENVTLPSLAECTVCFEGFFTVQNVRILKGKDGMPDYIGWPGEYGKKENEHRKRISYVEAVSPEGTDALERVEDVLMRMLGESKNQKSTSPKQPIGERPANAKQSAREVTSGLNLSLDFTQLRVEEITSRKTKYQSGRFDAVLGNAIRFKDHCYRVCEGQPADQLPRIGSVFSNKTTGKILASKGKTANSGKCGRSPQYYEMVETYHYESDFLKQLTAVFADAYKDFYYAQPLRTSLLVELLKAKGVTQLYHTNTVATSETFVKNGGLMSRGAVEDAELFQTYQTSDEEDQEYGIFYDIFFDGIDIHHLSGKNSFYGPVLFVYNVDVLKKFPEVRVTKCNPCGRYETWDDKPEESDRYFMTVGDFLDETSGYRANAYDNHITIRHQSEVLPFSEGLIKIVIDRYDVDGNNSENVKADFENWMTEQGITNVPVEIRRVISKEEEDRARDDEKLRQTIIGCRSECKCGKYYSSLEKNNKPILRQR